MNINRLYQIVLLACLAVPAIADTDSIRKNLLDRYPAIKSIDGIRPSRVSGLFEVRINETDIVYTDASGDTMFQGVMIDTVKKINLTEIRIAQLTELPFNALPIKDAFTLTNGKGERKLAVFADPNCGYCKQFEKTLEQLPNVTIYLFLYPILGGDSTEKSKEIWCAKDKKESWRNWMLNGASPGKVACDVSAIGRNVELGKKHKVTGTPTLIFANNERVTGAIADAQIESRLSAGK